MILLAVVLFSSLAIAEITEVNLPVAPARNSATDVDLQILSNGKETGVVATKDHVKIEIRNLASDKDLLVGINKEAKADALNSDTGAKLDPNGIKYSDVKAGIVVKVLNKAESSTKVFYIDGWDGKAAINISVCQDRDSDGKCEGTQEKASLKVELAGPSEISVDCQQCSTLIKCLACIDKEAFVVNIFK